MWRKKKEGEEEGERGSLRAQYVPGKEAAVRWVMEEQHLVVPETWTPLGEDRQTTWNRTRLRKRRRRRPEEM